MYLEPAIQARRSWKQLMSGFDYSIRFNNCFNYKIIIISTGIISKIFFLRGVFFMISNIL